MGILKAGGAYVPLDPIHPSERLHFILQDAHAFVLLTHESLAEKFSHYPGLIICLDSNDKKTQQENSWIPSSTAHPDNIAYVIYTSGSTGVSKGALVSHANVTRLFAATHNIFHFSKDDTWTVFHSFAFDFSVWELWGALLYGGRAVIISHLISRSPALFYDLLIKESVTVLSQTPSAFYQLSKVIREQAKNANLALRFVIFGGEVLEIQNLRLWFELYGDQKPQMVNMYGITETTVHVTQKICVGVI